MAGSNRPLDELRARYAPDAFWSRVAKRLVRKIFKPRFNWGQDIKALVIEMRDVEERSDYLLWHEELTAEFLTRLSHGLLLSKRISASECASMITFLQSIKDRNVSPWQDEAAQAIFLEACFEISRLGKPVITVRALLGYNEAIDAGALPMVPLPNRLNVDEWMVANDLNYSRDLSNRATIRKYRGDAIPEYHIHVARRMSADFAYCKDIQTLSKHFTRLDEAYASIVNDSKLSGELNNFVTKYNTYCEYAGN